MRVGEFKIRLLRVMQYANFITFIAAVLSAMKLYELPIWTAVFVIVPFLVLYWYDPDMLKGEFRYTNENNEEWQQVRSDVEAIKKLLEERNGNLGRD